MHMKSVWRHAPPFLSLPPLRPLTPVLAALWALSGLAGSVQAQDSGTVQGTVTDARTGAAVGSAQVVVVGTQRGSLTGADGTYRIANVTPGEIEVRVTYLGYRAASQSVTLGAGQVATADFQLAQSAVALDELIVTGTAGRQERRAQAASISSLDASALTEVAPVTSVANLLQARTAGVSVSVGSGTSGAAQRIRLRGSASINLSNDPIVIIDGVRMDARTHLPGAPMGEGGPVALGGQQHSRLNDINPNDIESIEIVKGPAAATLYGADATAGVIQIRTKRGQAGTGFTQNLSYEFGSLENQWDPPSNFGVCQPAHTEDPDRALCFGQAPGTVVADNPILRYGVFQRGEAHSVSWSGRGGGENFGYFVSFGANSEQGILPNNEYERYTGRLNFDFTPRDDLRLDASLGLGRTDTKLPRNDNNIFGYLGGSLLGSPLTVGLAQDGWFGSNRQVEAIAAIDNRAMSLRMTPVFTLNYNPLPWFTHRLSVGGDITRTEMSDLFPRNDRGWYATAVQNSGQITEIRENHDEVTVDYLGSVRRSLADDLVADLAFGAQVATSRTDINFAVGQGLITNAARSINAAGTTIGGGQRMARREAGLLAQLDLAHRDRLYLQLGGRLDRNSAFGREVSSFFNPKVGLSYVVSEEDFFPEGLRSTLSTLRLRSVWGSTGRSPDTAASLTLFDAEPFAVSPTAVDIGVVPLKAGNPDLRPERGVEWELGFDAGLLDERVGFEVTYYNKTSKDLILERPISPSLGFDDDPLVNIGEVVNRGWEASLNARLLDRPSFAWDTRLNISTNTNEVTDLGDVEPFGAAQQVKPGYPAFGWWTHAIQRFETVNDTVRAIVSNEFEFVGNPNPGWEGNFGTTFTFFQNFRLYAQIDWMQDYHINNNTAQFRERQNGTGERSVRRVEILTDEERATRFGPFFNEDGQQVLASQVNVAYFEDASHVRFRELTASYSLPESMAQLFRARGGSVSVGARNLALWTNYSGPDPEAVSNFNAAFGRLDFLTVPQPRRLIARVNLTF